MEHEPALGRKPYDLTLPRDQMIPLVFSSPHSGRFYPESFLAASRLDARTIRRSEDAYVDELFADVAELGAPLLAARFPRAFVDVNREPWELDPKMFCEPLPEWVNSHSLRVAGGLGTIARLVDENHEIYKAPIRFSEARTRILDLYHPYHSALNELMIRTSRRFSYCVLLDCHSMPSSALGRSRKQYDIIIGDRFGSSAARFLVDQAAFLLRQMGYNVLHNHPYAGGYITKLYGKPQIGWHAIQLEINRALYMDEATLGKNTDFFILREDLCHFCASLGDFCSAARQAAE